MIISIISIKKLNFHEKRFFTTCIKIPVFFLYALKKTRNIEKFIFSYRVLGTKNVLKNNYSFNFI